MLESQLQEVKDDMDNLVFKEMVFNQSNRDNVLRKLDVKPKKSFNIKLVFSYASVLSIFTFLVFSNVQFTGNSLGYIGINSTLQALELELNEQLITDARNGVFSPVPDVSIGMSINEVKEIIGKPIKEEHLNELDVVLFYSHFHLLFFENTLNFISINNITNVNKIDLINFFGNPDYEKYSEEHSHGLVTFPIQAKGNVTWYFNCYVDIEDKQTIKEIQFSNAEIRFKEGIGVIGE